MFKNKKSTFLASTQLTGNNLSEVSAIAKNFEICQPAAKQAESKQTKLTLLSVLQAIFNDG
jgi:hypothetical protein